LFYFLLSSAIVFHFTYHLLETHNSVNPDNWSEGYFRF